MLKKKEEKLEWLKNGLQKMDEENIPLTTFSAPQGHYEWIVMSFDLRNAPQIFQRRMDNIFKDLNHSLY